ncbi:MAG TPA: hypothetical protein VK447_08770 [Myxococcaceae bacterium]|nr:hypothetical protein [Myxococcaceae bacterium]
MSPTKTMENKTMNPRSRPVPVARPPRLIARPSRPRGMQTMGTALYQQIRQAVREMDARTRGQA